VEDLEYLADLVKSDDGFILVHVLGFNLGDYQFQSHDQGLAHVDAVGRLVHFEFHQVNRELELALVESGRDFN